VWFIANFHGEAAGDANGFISRVAADGTIEELRYMTGSAQAPLHGPRGMFILGETLWVTDADGVHGFDRTTGTQLFFRDFSPFQPGFLNDIALGPDGVLYVTDTGRSRIYRMAGEEITIAVEDPRLGPPNGITLDADAGRFLLAAWGDSATVRAWDPATGEITDVGTVRTGRFDGIELVDGRILVASQADSSLHIIVNGEQIPVIRTPGRPADIGIDTRRGRVAVPYIALDRVDIWPLPVVRRR
jgi:DNA-binding beta-propeller fold protein YncE